MTRFLFLFLMMAWALPTLAATLPPVPEIPPFPPIKSGRHVYHVNNESGKDWTNDGSAAQPWSTIENSARRLRAGDTLIVHGTKTAYPMNGASLVRSGSEDRWVTIEGKQGGGGERVVFQGRLSFGNKSHVPISYLHIKNILFQGAGTSGLNIKIHQDSHHLAFEDIEIDCQGNPQNARGLWTDNHAHHIWFKNVNVHHCGYQRNAPGNPPPPGWQPPTDCGGLCIKGDDIDEVVFLNVRATDNVGDGMGGGSKTAYGNSYFRNCVSERNSGDGFDIGGTRVVIVNSVARDNGGHQGAGFKFWSRESWLVNSVAYHNEDNGASVKPRHDGDHHAYILNSTIALNVIDRYGGQLGTTPKLPSNGKLFFHIHNTIFYAFNSSAIVLNNANTQIIKDESHNYYFSLYDAKRRPHWTYKHAVHFRDGGMKIVRGYSFPDMAQNGKWGADSGNGAGDIGEVGSVGRPDPGFMDLAEGDLRLAAGSSAIDAGVDMGIRSDIAGTPVPAGVAPDMGAYEFTGRVPGDKPAP